MSTHLNLTSIYADRLIDALRAAPVLMLEDVYSHPAVAGFSRPTIERIVAVLVADGRLSDDECGRLIVADMTKDAA